MTTSRARKSKTSLFAAILVSLTVISSLVFAGNQVSSADEPIPATPTMSQFNMASVEVLMGSEVLPASYGVQKSNGGRKSISEVETENWKYIDATSDIKGLLTSSTTPAGANLEQYPGNTTLWDQFYSYKSWWDPGTEVHKSPNHYLSHSTGNVIKGGSQVPAKVGDPTPTPINWSNPSAKLPGAGGFVAKVAIYELDGTIVPNARFKAQIMGRGGTGTYKILGADTGQFTIENSKPSMTFYDCDPSASASCAPIPEGQTIGGANPTAATASPGEAEVKTSADGYVYIWVSVGGIIVSNYSDFQLRISDFAEGAAPGFPAALDYSGVFPAYVTTPLDDTYYTPDSTKLGFQTKRTTPWVPGRNNSATLNYANQGTVFGASFATPSKIFGSVVPFSKVTYGTCLWGSTLADPASATGVISPDSKTAGTGTTTLTVKVKNLCGTALAGQKITVVLPDGSQVVLTTGANGQATYTIPDNMTEAEKTYPLYLGNFPTGTPPTGDPYASPDVSWLAPPVPDASKSSIVIDKPSNAADGSSSATVTVTIRDQFGNPVPAGTEVCLEKSSGLGVLGAGPWTTGVGGTVTTTITSPTTLGSATITAWVGPCSDKGASVGDVDMDFIPGAPSASSSEIKFDQVKAPADGTSKSKVTVTLKDANGNPVAAGQEICLFNSGAGTMAAGPWTTDAEGKVVVDVTSPTTAGTANITAKIGACPGTGPDLGPVTVDFVPSPDASKSSIVIDKPSNAADGSSSATVTVTIRDQFGNPVPAGTEVCLEKSSGLGVLGAGPWTTGVGGTVTTTITSPTTLGSATITAWVGPCSDKGASVGDVDMDFIPGAPSASSSEIKFDQVKAPADGTSKSKVTVTLKDANGNPVAAGQEICLFNSGAGTMAAGPWTTDAEGKVVVDVTSPTTAGTANITAKIGACPGTGPDLGPVTVDFVPPPSADNSSIEIDKNKIPADGNSKAEVKVQLKDANGDPIAAGVEVCLAIMDGSGELAEGPWQTDENGAVAAMLTAPNEAGETTVTAFVGSCEDRGLEVGSVNITFNKVEEVLAETGTPVLVAAFLAMLFLLGGFVITRRRKVQA